jgi:hypothetical protein
MRDFIFPASAKPSIILSMYPISTLIRFMFMLTSRNVRQISTQDFHLKIAKKLEIVTHHQKFTGSIFANPILEQMGIKLNLN